MAQDILTSIRSILATSGIDFREVRHEPTHTSEQSARARGEPLRNGGKALLMKVGGVFRLFVLSAALKADSAAIRRHFGVKHSRFASADELKQQTGLVPGSVPPFGRPILPFDLFVDESIVKNERIAFNAGSLTDSIILSVEDYLAVAKPEIFAFSIGK
ncbi:MAG: YbaK/EbsC family protein [Phycisphaerae bacterium]